MNPITAKLLTEVHSRRTELNQITARQRKIADTAMERRLDRFNGDLLLEISSPGDMFDDMTEQELAEWNTLRDDRKEAAAAYNLAADKYNDARVLIQQQGRARAARARADRNQALAQAARAAACPVCFTTHAGEC